MFGFYTETFSYLSLVVLSVEEVCVPGQVYHGSDVVLGLVNDGQVQQPEERDAVNEGEWTDGVSWRRTSQIYT